MPFSNEEERKAYAKAHYEKNKHVYKERNNRSRQKREDFVFDLKKNNPCADCGEFYHPCQMQYDHIADDKEATVSWLVRNGTIKKIETEIAKCELVCANCHALRTWTRHEKNCGSKE
ncbi:HNH endonuclease [Streptomyces phage EGole]|uniref:HNH endonuclease n=1 Tax=Streptomyces phage EGole TaxID=2517973 RepID=A0A482JAW2_9CAUD|nr:HNH endonuclease [Streptomyces phage EGole]QBP31020.1 hypothetical protein SEA_EGOLE_125 [Streptomyces phage EGole]